MGHESRDRGIEGPAPRPPRRALPPLFALLLACAHPLAAQAVGGDERALRGSVLGVVEDAAGAAVAGAEVVLVARPLAGRVDAGEVDVVRARTDAQGRFRARCLRGLPYSAWAWWPARDGGPRAGDAPQLAGVLEDVVPGPPIVLRHLWQWAPQTLRVTGLDAWRHLGPATVMVYGETRNAFGRAVELDAEGRGALPPLPGAGWHCEVRAGDGRLLRDALLLRGRPAEVVVGAPTTRRLRVQDAAGAPIAGAVVAVAPFSRPGGRHARLVPEGHYESDAEGLVQLELPAGGVVDPVPQPPLLLVTAAGCADTLVAMPRDATATPTVTLARGSAVAGRLLDGDGRGLVGVALLGEFDVAADGEPRRFPCPRRPLVTDADGRFRIVGRPAGAPLLLRSLLPVERARAAGLRLQRGVPLVPTQPLRVVPAAGDDGGDVDLGDLWLRDASVCRVEVRGHDGAPAAGVQVQVEHGDGMLRQWGAPDLAGRLQFCHPDRDTKVLAWVAGGGVAIASVRDAVDGALDVRLSEPVVVSGRVLDAAGEPVHGAVVRPLWGEGPRFEDPLWALVLAAVRESEPTDERGRYRIALPFAHADWRLQAWVVEDSRWWSGLASPAPTDGRQVDLTYSRR